MWLRMQPSIHEMKIENCFFSLVECALHRWFYGLILSVCEAPWKCHLMALWRILSWVLLSILRMIEFKKSSIFNFKLDSPTMDWAHMIKYSSLWAFIVIIINHLYTCETFLLTFSSPSSYSFEVASKQEKLSLVTTMKFLLLWMEEEEKKFYFFIR